MSTTNVNEVQDTKTPTGGEVEGQSEEYMPSI